MSNPRHQCSSWARMPENMASVLSLQLTERLYNMVSTVLPDMIPLRTVHHRFIVLRRPIKILRRYHKHECRDKGTWRCECNIVIYVINTGETVYEKN